MLLPLIAFSLLVSNCAFGSGYYSQPYGYSPHSYSPYGEHHSFDSAYGLGNGFGGDFSHSNDHNHAIANGYAEGDRGEWPKLSYGGHKSEASGDSYSQQYENDHGNDFGHNNHYDNGFDHGHNLYGSYYSPGSFLNAYPLSYH
jgi:hypothetical protein